jgi:hypothetical protein
LVVRDARHYALNHPLSGEWRKWELEYSRALKKRNLLIFRDAKNAEHGEIVANWNVSGTQGFSHLVEFRCPRPLEAF